MPLGRNGHPASRKPRSLRPEEKGQRWSRQSPPGATPSGCRGPAGRRRQSQAVSVLAAMAVLMSVASCSGDRGSLERGSSSRPGQAPAAPGPTGSTSAPTSGSESTVTTTPPAAHTAAGDGTPRFAVGTLLRDFADTSRQRVLHAIVHFPAKGRPGQAGTEPAGGGRPPVVLAHGVRLPPLRFERTPAQGGGAGGRR